ncbi:hypothetical protein PFISCL1PPCAC_11133, partial [Pristionchus fissidentatus]
IYPGELVLTSYYFPTASSKRIDTKTITGIYYCKQKYSDTVGVASKWGVSATPCWWACDSQSCRLQRGERRGCYNVVIDCGERTMKGFTTNNLRHLLSVLRQQCQPNVVCKEGYPW